MTSQKMMLNWETIMGKLIISPQLKKRRRGEFLY